MDEIESGLAAEPNTKPYSDAIDKLRESAKKLLNTEEDFDDEFWTENFKLIKRAAKGA
jgi:hypothetical protein